MIMKKLTVLLLVLCLLLTTASCGANGGKEPTGADNGSQSQSGGPLAMNPTSSEEASTEEVSTEEPTTEEPTTEAATEATTEAPTEPKEPDADVAMENFVKKLQAGNYVVAPKLYTRTTAYSPEQVTFTQEGESGSYEYAFITLNGETFEAMMENDAVVDIAFASVFYPVRSTISSIAPSLSRMRVSGPICFGRSAYVMYAPAASPSKSGSAV